jgi:hypothetical protein
VAKPKLVQITRAYGKPQENSPAIPRNHYVEIRAEKPTSPKQAEWPEYKTCKFTTEAIVTEGSDKGEIRRICSNADCPIHHPKKEKTPANDGAFKAAQEKQRREETIAQATGLRVLSAIGEAVRRSRALGSPLRDSSRTKSRAFNLCLLKVEGFPDKTPGRRRGRALLYIDRKVKRKQISGLLLVIDPNDKKHPRSTNDLYPFTRPRDVQRFPPPCCNHTASTKSKFIGN